MSVTGFTVDGQIQKYDYNSLDNLPDIPENSGTFWATYNVTTETEITNAFSDNKNVMMKFGNDVFLVTRKLGIGPSGSAWLFTSVGQTNIRTTWVSGSYWNAFSTNAIGGDISNNLKQALLQIASKIAYIDEYGQTYYNDLYNALYPHELMSISATFNQGSNIIYDIDPLTVLNQYLTVVANYSDGTTETISSSNYTLSGNLLEGVSTITVYYEGFTDTFNVNVTHMAGYYTIVNNLTGCTTNNSATAIQENTSYTATITASAGYTLSGATVTITMGGNILTGVFSNGTISIPNVTGDLVITVVASAITVSSISAVYTQTGTVYDTDTLDSLKDDLVVTAHYSDSSTQTVPAADYTLSGTLTEGTSTITVSYGGKTTTFSVTVTAAPYLPSEYQRVEYIEATTAGPVIDTLVVPGENAEIRCGIQQLVAGTSTGIFGGSASILMFMWQTSELYANFGRSTSKKFNGITLFDSLHTVVLNKTELIYDGTSRGTFSGDMLDFTGNTHHMMIFAWGGDNDIPSRSTAGRCSYFQIYESGTLVADLIPCYRKSDGVIGMYDAIARAFRTNIGTGSFVKGNDVEITLSSISAVYTQTGTVYDTDTLDSLKADLVVTAHYSDSSTAIVTNYTLSGTLTIGTSTITVSYDGKTTTFSVTVTASQIPNEYQRVEWIEANNGPVIDTLWTPDADSEIHAGVQYVSYPANNKNCIFGSTNPSVLFLAETNTTYMNFARSSSVRLNTNILSNSLHNVVLNKDTCTVDGEIKATFSGSPLAFDTPRRMFIFAYPSNDQLTPDHQSNSRCSYFKAYDSNNTLEVDLVACYRKADGVIGMYDRVAQAFRTNIGTGTFTKGGNVT